MYPWFGSVLILVFDEENYVSISRPSFLIDLTSNLIKEDAQAAEDILYLQCQHKLPSTFRNFLFLSLTKPIGFQRFNSKNSVWIWSKFTHFSLFFESLRLSTRSKNSRTRRFRGSEKVASWKYCWKPHQNLSNLSIASEIPILYIITLHETLFEVETFR